MAFLEFKNSSRETALASRVTKAGILGRLLGLLPRASLGQDEGLWLLPCRSVHSFGMRFRFDAVFLDRTLQVVGLVERCRPFRLLPFFTSAYGVLELPAGTILRSRTQVGDQLWCS